MAVAQAAVGVAALLGSAVVTACGGESSARGSGATGADVRPLALRQAPITPLRVRHYVTHGTYPRASGGGDVDLRRVNAALRQAVIDDETAYARTIRAAKAALDRTNSLYRVPGRYRTRFDRDYASASTGVVSALMPLTRELFPGQHGGDGWLAVTVAVPSGRRISALDLFTNRRGAIRALAAAWRAKLGGAVNICAKIYPESYRATARNYSHFALLANGIAVGSWEVESCYRFVTVLPYSVIEPYLSPLGKRLVSAVRIPR